MVGNDAHLNIHFKIINQYLVKTRYSNGTQGISLVIFIILNTRIRSINSSKKQDRGEVGSRNEGQPRELPLICGCHEDWQFDTTHDAVFGVQWLRKRKNRGLEYNAMDGEKACTFICLRTICRFMGILGCAIKYCRPHLVHAFSWLSLPTHSKHGWIPRK